MFRQTSSLGSLPPAVLTLLTLVQTLTHLLFVIVQYVKWISGSLWAVPPPHCGIFSHNCCASIALGRENLARESYWVRLSPCTTITAKVHLTPNCSSGAVKWLTVQDCAALSSSLVWMCVIAWMWSRVLFWKKKKYLGVSQLQGPLSCQIFHPLALLIKCEICLFAFFFFL